MKLGEFIEKFSHNNLIRLVYKDKGGYKTVSNTWDDISMDWEVNKGKGIFRHYINNEVLGLVSICVRGNPYPETINIIIEELEDQPFIDEINNEKNNHESVN